MIAKSHLKARFHEQQRQVHNGPWIVKFITALLSVYQYSLGKKKLDQKNIWVKVFGSKNI